MSAPVSPPLPGPSRVVFWARLAAAGVLALGVAVAVRWALREHLQPRQALLSLRQAQGHWWTLPAFLGAYAAVTAACGPAVVFHIVAGAAWGLWKGLLVNVLAFNTNAALHFAVARRLGRARVAALLSGFRFEAFDAAAQAHGFRATLGLRSLPLPSVITNSAAGVSSIRFRDFILGSAVGAMPYIVIYTALAASLVEGAAGAERRALLQSLVGGAVLLFLALAGRIRRKR